MARKDYTPEQAIGMLREAEVRLSQGEKIARSVGPWDLGAELLPVASPVWRAEGRSGEAPEGP
jgi:hypothetical protein